jgi:hypothetical protein
MTAVLERSATPAAPQEATRALALTEARLLLRSPTLWVGVALTVGLCTTWVWTWEPVWDVFTTNAGMASLVLAGFLILLGHLAASRDQRHGAHETAATLPATAQRRTTALLALVPVGGLVGAAAFGLELLALMPAWPAGVFDPWTALIPVVLPMMGAAIGVGVGRWLPSTAAGPLALFAGAAGLAVLPVLGTSADSMSWHLFPVVLEESPAPGFPRPTGWHLVYLLAFLAVVVAAALLRHRRLWPGLAAALALALAVAGVQRQVEERAPAGPDTVAATERYLVPAVQRCERHEGVDYCALPGYGRWVPLWRDAVEPVVHAVPPAVGGLPAVRQGIGPASSVVIDLHWGRHGEWADNSRIGLAQEYVRVLLGMPDWESGRQGPVGPAEQRRAAWPSGTMQVARGPMCSGAGQLRTVVGLYLVAQAEADGRRLLDAPGRLELGRVRFGVAERDAAAKLLDAPREQVSARLAESWVSVRSAASVGDFLAPFGVGDIPATGEEGEPACP